ncbi:MAG: UvrD-helicase domain-containing protein [Rhodospirillaceae bacterium]|nr:UvrD-helicase domain-containing protein [Rhodospirillaceae bacterium]
MKTAQQNTFADHAAREEAIANHGRSFLVEAGAGSGKTAIIAGRIAMMLADGIEPKSIAAVTFTEFAASELLIRVREFASELAAGRIPLELRIAAPDGLSEDQRRHLAAAIERIDELTCSTIHGFCQRLIKPYPVEARIDPGATVMDSDQADLAFSEIVDSWRREELVGEAGGLFAELALQNAVETLRLMNMILGHLRSHRVIIGDTPRDLRPLVTAFRKACDDFKAFARDANVHEEETTAIADLFAELAEKTAFAQTADTAAELVELLLVRPPSPSVLCIASGDFRKYQKKSKWTEAAKREGLAKADGERLNYRAASHYEECRETWTELLQSAASRILNELIRLARPVMERFHEHKRSAALLDFDDLIFSARDLLRDHDEVRHALARRFSHVLVDEFQDTDPLQTEIFWRLCGDPPPGGANDDWTQFQIRPGALFLVGDPKQAIYRFRGADIAAYIRARQAFRSQDPDSVLSIATNFRSCAPIMRYVNRLFESPLSAANGQPGFIALDPFQPDRDEGPSVAALDIEVADKEGRANAQKIRDGEAEAVANLCAQLIGKEAIVDRKSGERRVCKAGDIALLAPTGNDLWRYEEALERRRIPVATQAGKGLFRRQEIQDLIAVTRVLADQRDTLALGALLRGPLVGLTEEELLDIVWQLPRSEEAPERLPRLDLRVSPEDIPHRYARDIIEKLQALRRRVNATTPHDLLSQAVDVLRVRPILLQRHRDQAERALANVDLYLSFSRGYSVRGLRAFAEAMTEAWSDATRAVEGRPDVQEEAVTLYSMHAAKGLEWPIVIPVNTMTKVKTPESAVTDRASGRFYCPVFGVPPTGYEAARDAEKAELDRERIRIWYVATTRARELLILPRFDVNAKPSSWISLIDPPLSELPPLSREDLPLEVDDTEPHEENRQTREIFAAEAAAIMDRKRKIVWLTPSRDESAAAPVLQAKLPEIVESDADGAAAASSDAAMIQGGRERGLILHKLMEEVLSGETAESRASLMARAECLISATGHRIAEDPARGLSPAELANCVVRTLSLPEIALLKPRLMPELPVYASALKDTQEEVTAGVADAIAFDADGAPQVVVDWKSDVSLKLENLEHYCSQVRAYLDMTQAERGLVVAMTSGTVVPVRRTEKAVDSG